MAPGLVAMPDQIETYEVCLPDWGSILPGLAALIDAAYSQGQFETAEDEFCDSGRDQSEWTLLGASALRVTVKFEKYEGYFFGAIQGAGEVHSRAKQYLWAAYLDQGGNPDAQPRP